MNKFSEYSNAFAVMISKMSLTEIAKLAETSSEMRDKIKSIKITATNDGTVVGAVTPYNMYNKYDHPAIHAIVRGKILAENKPELTKKYLAQIIANNDLELFKQYCEVDPEPVRTIIEIMKVHKGQNDLIDHMLTLTKAVISGPGNKAKKVNLHKTTVYILSPFLQNAYYSTMAFVLSRNKFDILLKYKSELGYISDEFYNSIPKPRDDFRILLTETCWKRTDWSFINRKIYGFGHSLAKYNSDRELSLNIFRILYGDEEKRYLSHYFAHVKFWKTEYGRQLFSEKCATDKKIINPKLIRKMLKNTYRPFELSAEYPDVFTEQLILDLALKRRNLAKVVMKQRPQLITDSEGYLKSDYIGVFSDGNFLPTLNIREEDVIEYVCGSLETCDYDDDDANIKELIDFLLHPNVADICKEDKKCVQKVFNVFANSPLSIAELKPENVLSVFDKLGIDYEKLYDVIERKFEEHDYEISSVTLYIRWDQKIRKLITERDIMRKYECGKL